MRNIFDQYEQPENRLTHALVCTLHADPGLIRPFFRWLGIAAAPPASKLRLTEQQIPGIESEFRESESKGLPDACFYTDDGWAVLIESKVQAGISIAQLKRHRSTAKRRGFEAPQLLLIAVDRPRSTLPPDTFFVEWREVYRWFGRKSRRSKCALTFCQYMQVFEAKMISQEYNIRGTLTMFDGLRFDDDNPYTYREGKRLIRLLGDELQRRTDLVKLGVDPKGRRRPAITGRGQDRVWDFLPLKVARRAKHFTDYPHLTIGISREGAIAAVTVPNRVKGGFRTKLKAVGPEGFRKLVGQVERGLRPVLKRARGAKPIIYATQHHYRGQRSVPEVDARIDADLRTILSSIRSAARSQPEWVDAIYQVLCNKRSNIQFGFEVRFRYECPVIRSRAAVALFAEAWKAMWPVVDFVLRG